MANITLTPEEAKALYNHLDCYIIQEIKDMGDEYDNMDYLARLVSIYNKCKEATNNEIHRQ